MALIKSTTYKGLTFEYWKIITYTCDATNGLTFGTVAAYKDKATREESVTNFIEQLSRSFSFPGELTKAQIYEKLKESDKDDDGNELNFFADAVDD